jgi:hypothetical protein
MRPSDAERIKLTANWLNAMSSGTILASVVAPYIGFGMGTLTVRSDLLNLLGLSGFGLMSGVVLHFIARRILAMLED